MFFVPVKAIMEHEVLDVNKIHFILASIDNKKYIVDEIFKYIDLYKEKYKLENKERYYSKYAIKSRFDTEDIVFIKKMLQDALPEKIRKIIINNLFKSYVSKNEEAFSRELYMSLDQIKCMRKNGMYIGAHGYDHYWLNSLDEEAQRREIDLSMDFLKLIDAETNGWVMCYPYGAYNESVIEILKENGCSVGFTTKVSIADLSKDNNLVIPRLDTNDLPKDRDAAFRAIV